MNDSLSLEERMKGYESAEAGRRLMPLLPALARLDGRAFGTDHQVAATLVQWLGIEVGIRWLRETIKKVDSEDYRRCFEARRK